MENKNVMTKPKSKSIIIDGEVHGSFKHYCKGRNLKIGGVIEQLIKLYLKNPSKIQRLIEGKD